MTICGDDSIYVSGRCISIVVYLNDNDISNDDVDGVNQLKHGCQICVCNSGLGLPKALCYCTKSKGN